MYFRKGNAMSWEVLEKLMERKLNGEESLESSILDTIARDVYERPGIYGLRSDADAGELFDTYWPRIVALVGRYEDMGASFKAYLITSIRYMAMSIRRKKAKQADREAVYLSDIQGEYDAWSESRNRLSFVQNPGDRGVQKIPKFDDMGPSAVAFRKRIIFLCLKCANSIDDDDVVTIARRVGLDETMLVELLKRARAQGLGIRKRTASRRRGRDAAWLRMGVNKRRLSRETDVSRRRYLEDAIDKDSGRFSRGSRLISRSVPVVSNKSVAEFLGIPKGTVDCGVNRILKQYSSLFSG
jgi:DNA-directed RNA polymerase specialized sigma24 family protein